MTKTMALLPWLLVTVCPAIFAQNAADFPYNLSIVNDGPVLFDTPVTVTLTLVPLKKAASSSPAYGVSQPQYFFHWIDHQTTIDCPYRLSHVTSPSPLASVYNATYHYLWLICPPVWSTGGRRTVGVQVFDDPDFDPDWTTPVAQIQTSFQMVERVSVNVTARQCTFDIPDHPSAVEESFFLVHRAVAFTASLHDPSGVLGRGNVSHVWSVKPSPNAPHPPEDTGPAFLFTFDAIGYYDVTVLVAARMERPRYPGKENKTGTVTKKGSTTKRVAIIEETKKLRLIGNGTVAEGDAWQVVFSAEGKNRRAVEKVRRINDCR